MKPTLSRFRSSWTCALIVCCMLLCSCASTYEGQMDQVGGTLAGAAFGAIMGGLIGGNVESVLIGAAAGGMMGWSAATVAHYETNRVRSSAEDRKMYGLTTGVSTPTIKIRQGTVSPDCVKPGQEITVVTDYSLYLPAGTTTQVPVEEYYVLMKDGKELHKLPPQSKTLAEGGYTGKAAIKVPRNIKAGTYVIEHRTSTGSSYDVTTTSFVVGS